MRSAASSGYAWLVSDWQWPYAAAFAACFLLGLGADRPKRRPPRGGQDGPRPRDHAAPA